jgi:hypothetical protein
MDIYFKVVHSWPFLTSAHTVHRIVLVHTITKWACPTRFSTSVPTSGRTQCQFLKPVCHCEVVMTCVLEDTHTDTPCTYVHVYCNMMEVPV